MKTNLPVRTWLETLVIPTYLPAAPDKNPMFLEKRVYQGSSGKVYPLPFTDRIAEKPVDRKWKAVWIENEFIRALVLPELGGRIHAIQDKANGYDLIYNQHVIKPALVGLAGPWASGGIEFNWPQHHRPATFLPANFEIEKHADGSQTIWCGDHDPMSRMKGMHGVCLYPGKSFLELKVRAYNRTPHTQTFLWWANVATRVHEAYQSFFPPDVSYVADHARRSMSEYPLAQGHYYGVNYGQRGRTGIPQNEIPAQFVPPHCAGAKSKTENSGLPGYAPNDLSFYANIPVPTSYMCMGSNEDFFGGYDFKAQAGIVHIANHHISPGKKQWTWGNHEFGHAWDRNLTNPDARGECSPYIEIMAGVYTDNQPDFSFLQPGETKTWSQYWYPIQKTGPAQHANLQAALSLKVAGVSAGLGVCVTQKYADAEVCLIVKGKKLFSKILEITPTMPFVARIKLPRGAVEADLRFSLKDSCGREIISYQPKPRVKAKVPPPATEPPAPGEISSTDELFITGLHLEQYRHATRCPTIYWREALRRDPLDSRCNNAMGLWHFKRGEFARAENYFSRAIERLARRNANPADGEAYYNLGLCLRHLGRDDGAYAALYKACWNHAWQSAGHHALAEIDCKRRNWADALGHLDWSLRVNVENLRARNLRVIVLRKLGRDAEAKQFLHATLRLDPLDWWARHLNGEILKCDSQTALDIAHDFARAGFYAEAMTLLACKCRPFPTRAGNMAEVLPDQNLGANPMVQYTICWLRAKSGGKTTDAQLRILMEVPPDYCFPSRLEEIVVLEWAIQANPKDAKAVYYLGNLLYDRRRHTEAVRLWEKSVSLDKTFSIAWRNLGLGYFNILKKPGPARMFYDLAFKANPGDARLLYERDQLWKRLGDSPVKRLRELKKRRDLVEERDDLSVEICALLNHAGSHVEAMQLLAKRNFQPWEGGEGAALGQHVRTQLALGRKALVQRDFQCATSHFESALTAPRNLGEARHLLANQSDVHYWLGIALDLLGKNTEARRHWLAAAQFKGDFQEMSTRAFSELTYYSALSFEMLGRKTEARALFRELLAHAKQWQKGAAKIDYFATSLPTMLIFEDDLQRRQETTAIFLQAQAQLGLGKISAAKKLLIKVLGRDPSHALAGDLLAELRPWNSL